MIKPWFMLLLLLPVLLACGGNSNGNGGAAETTTRAAAPNMVLMNATEFVPDSVTIAVDSPLTLKAEGFVPHFIANGTWQNGNAVAAAEPGAPVVDALHIDGGQEDSIGPFTDAGTYQFYCTIHPGMNLTVTVE